jgi:hypothetical protein
LILTPGGEAFPDKKTPSGRTDIKTSGHIEAVSRLLQGERYPLIDREFVLLS